MYDQFCQTVTEYDAEILAYINTLQAGVDAGSYDKKDIVDTAAPDPLTHWWLLYRRQIWLIR